MAAMKLYFGENPVGGDVDLAEFEQLKGDVEGKYDKGDPSILDGGAMKYGNAALLEEAVVANASDLASIHQQVEDVLGQLGSENITVEFGKYFQKYADGDAVDSLMYDFAAQMSVDVKKNTQEIELTKNAIVAGDNATLNEAKAHSDANDTVTLNQSQAYTDAEIAKIPGAEGIIEVEENAVRNANKAQNQNPTGGVENIAVVVALPAIKDPNTLYIVTG